MVSPTQNIKELSFLARIRDSKFKNKLMNMNIGEEMEISQSDGLWTLECSTKRNVMFIVGGVGVAPVMSIVNSATSSVYNFALLSSNRSQAATPFYKELYQDWHNKKCSTYFAFTRESSSLDRIFNKRIDESMISNVLKTGFPNNQFADICFYICGGSEFVVEIRRLLLSLAINVNDIKLDLFTGY
jgi:ferredoxin-NADP reductase